MKDESSDDDNKSVLFQKFGAKSSKSNIVTDFENRDKIVVPSNLALMKGLICRERATKRFMRLHKRSYDKVEQEMDMLKFIRAQRFTQIALYALLNRE